MKFTSGLPTALAAIAIIGASSALAADMAVHKSPPKPAAPNFNWTGWYGGFNYGTGVAQTQAVPTPGFGSVDRAGSGFSAGVQAGYNWHFSPMLVGGIEADINWLGIDRYTRDLGDTFAFGVKTNWYGTARARLGYASSPSLFYITGGAAFVSLANRYDFLTIPRTETRIADGWTAGWGVETMLGGNWSAKAEYLYVDAGSTSTVRSGGAPSTALFDNRFHLFRKGLNYRFGDRTAAPPAHNWSGPYIGYFAGAGATEIDAISPRPPAFGNSVDVAESGITGGIHAGYNFQIGRDWMAGVEADIGWLGLSRTQENFLQFVAFGVETEWYATVRARFARSVGPALLYVTGGAAFVKIENRYDDTFTPLAASNSRIAAGWTVGGGIEAVLGNGWTGKTEYLYIDAGSQSVFNAALASTARFDNRFHVFRFGMNRQFASGAAR